MNAPADPLVTARTAFAIMTAVRNDDFATPRVILAELDRGELRSIIWALLGANRHLTDFVAADLGSEEFEIAWQRTAVELAGGSAPT